VLSRDGRFAAPPALSAIGLAEEDAVAAATPLLRNCVERTVAALPLGQRRDDESVREAVRRALRRPLFTLFGKRPLIEVQLVRVAGERE
jgi:ribonuclease J